MPEALSQALATPGLIWLVLAISVAGMVRGFAGFGQALIFVPIAGMFIPPQFTVGLIAITDVASAGVLLPRAWRQGNRREVAVLAIAAGLAVPLGLWLAGYIDPIVIRWIVTVIAGVTLLTLLSGWRFSFEVKLVGLILIGVVAGLLGGMTGLTGPIVILFYLAGRSVAQTVRANTILFLLAVDVIIIVNLLFMGALDATMLSLAAVLIVPYLVASVIGQAMFDPSYERLYRVIAYVVIALAVLRGLPVWG